METPTKISFRLGEIEFSGEGTEDWLEKQLDKLLDKIASRDLHTNVKERPVTPGKSHIAGTLASFLGEKNAKSNQNRKFLATATYLQLNKGIKPLKTNDISSALKDANQTRLGNPSDTLSQNISKGFCERDGGGFFVTDEGYQELGMEGY